MPLAARIAAIAALSATFAAPAAFGARPPTSKLLEQASKQVDAGEFEAALITLQDALASPDNSNDELVRVYWKMGEVYVFVKRDRAALDAFERLLYLAPDFPPPRLTSPQVRRTFERARKSFDEGGKQVALEVPPQRAIPPDRPFAFEARIAGLRDGMVARVYYRRALTDTWLATELRAGDGGSGVYAAQLPAFPAGTAVEFYVEIQGSDRRRLQGEGSSLAPRTLRVSEPLPAAAIAPPGDRGPARAPPVAWYGRPWVWGVAAAVVIGGGVAYVVTREPDPATLRLRVTVTP